MKNIITLLLLCASLSIQSQNLEGAWQSGSDENHIVMIVAGKFFSAAVYNKKTGAYIGTCGGTWSIEKNHFIEVHEFNTMHPEWIGTEQKSEVKLKGNQLTFKTKDRTDEFSRLDNGTPGALSGAWLITGRVTDNGQQKMTPGARRTMKILSGTRFQWIAYNVDTKEFFGTGGGTYTTLDGKYTETIEVFSRDNSRVGANLEFDYSIKEGDWHHSGKSSKGDPINEIWSKREKIGL
ncbi:MAG: lipocalin-like domain-containing protein [Cyclobacteriaceae bacterium]|nr:lipocalin-like domain-containing protein [Cyclobacteriaceae bacterium]